MLYDYKCPICGYEAEVDHPMSYDGIVTCGFYKKDPKKACQGEMVKQFKKAPMITAHSLPSRKRINFMK